jgi:hypothetical protein
MQDFYKLLWYATGPVVNKWHSFTYCLPLRNSPKCLLCLMQVLFLDVL